MSDKTLSKPRRLRTLIVDDEADICRMLTMCLEADGHSVISVSTIAAALEQANRSSIDLIFLDLRLGTENGLDAIGPLLESSPWVQIAVITAFAAVDTAVTAMQRGASEYLAKPFTPAQVRMVVRKVADALTLSQRAAALQDAVTSVGPAIDFETASAEMREAVELARRAAEGGSTILIHGEPGTGKRTLARAVHGWSGRAERPFAVAGCRAPTVALLEAEWFGTAKPMPGGKVAEKPGRVAFCEGGTMLVEDIDQLPLQTQPKVLRLIQNQEFERPGDFVPHRADVRIVASTSVDLDQRVAGGSFYTDLFFALRSVVIELPPLRRRPDDVVLLAERYLAFFTRQTRRTVSAFSPSALDALRRHSWPGNIRELRNVVERSVLTCRTEIIEMPDLPRADMNRVNAVALGDPVPLERIEELHIRGVLAASASIDAAAATLGMDTVTLWRRRKQYGI